MTWGSEDDVGQSFLTSGQHGVLHRHSNFFAIFFSYFSLRIILLLVPLQFVKETPEPFPLPTEAPIVNAAAGWAHCVSLTGTFPFAEHFCPIY